MITNVLRKLLLSVIVLPILLVTPSLKAAGVTIITHGADGDVTGWVTAIADEIPPYFGSRYPELGTNFTVYTLTITNINGSYYYQCTHESTNSSSTTVTGEIIVKLDWSQMAGIDPLNVYDASTYTIAQIASWIILQTNTFPDLNGHALAEYPIHLIGHSRGGSVMSQISYVLGTNGVWVDHLTTLDPHPLNNDIFDSDPLTWLLAIDAPVHTYSNVLFHDNYYQNEGILTDPDGEPVAGAYIRNLNSAVVTEGYNGLNISADHSNVHLWYYGTVNLATPNTTDDDGEYVTIDSTMRQNWWTPYEYYGYNAGFRYSLIGGGNRTNTDYPEGLPSDPQVIDGYNQNWDLGAGTSANRTLLPENNGTWPNVIKFDATGTNITVQGNPILTTLHYQYGGSSNLTLQIYFDRDFNPLNTNSISVKTLQPPVTGTDSVYQYSNLALPTTNVPPGFYAIYAKISDGPHTRYLYTPELVQITPNTPDMDISIAGSHQLVVGVNGVANQKIILLTSADLQNWVPVATNTLTSTRWAYTNSVPVKQQFFRATLSR